MTPIRVTLPPKVKERISAKVTEMDALVAYLQMLGTLVDTKAAAPQEQVK